MSHEHELPKQADENESEKVPRLFLFSPTGHVQTQQLSLEFAHIQSVLKSPLHWQSQYVRKVSRASLSTVSFTASPARRARPSQDKQQYGREKKKMQLRERPPIVGLQQCLRLSGTLKIPVIESL